MAYGYVTLIQKLPFAVGGRGRWKSRIQ